MHATEGKNSDDGKQSLPKRSHKNPSVWAGGSGRPLPQYRAATTTWRPYGRSRTFLASFDTRNLTEYRLMLSLTMLGLGKGRLFDGEPQAIGDESEHSNKA